MKIINIDGGIGRVICSTPAINVLAKVEPVTVITSWPAVFENNPYIEKCYGAGSDYLWDDVISKGEFIYPEPYHDYRYYNQKDNITQSFAHILGLDSVPNCPELFLSEGELLWAKEWKKKALEINKKTMVIAYQPFGAGTKMSDWGMRDDSHRSLSGPDALYIADSITENIPASLFVNCSHIASNHSNIWQQEFSLRQMFAIGFVSDLFVGVDSSMSHVMAAFGKTGVLILGATFKENVGYSNYVVMQKEGYPKSYYPNRFSGWVDKNKDAMVLESKHLDSIVETAKQFSLEARKTKT